jgi:UDP-N-acetylmuramoyl-tripeptide--D-alanyl-D-alanine ligase
MRLTAVEVVEATGGTLPGDDPAVTSWVESPPVVTGPVVADSRQVQPGSLFVAVRGERVDGHAYGPQAAAAGAVLALGERRVEGLPTVLVDATVPALGRLATSVLRRLPDAYVVGLTGSSGKTTTKDLLAALLGELGPTVAPPGSYNTEVGLPLTVLTADEATRFVVLEMGARGVGHVRTLTGIAPPRTGVVLNVGSAHLGEFGSVDAVAQAKGELVEALPADGLAVLNADDPRVLAMGARTSARVVTVGRSADADLRAVDESSEAGRPSFRLVAPQGTADVRLRLVGAHQVSNALAAAAVALDRGLPLERVARVLSTAEPVSRWRMEVVERPDGVTLVNDAYNANPESTAAALRTVAAMATGRRSWAVLGEMLELGEASSAQHAAVGRLAAELGVDHLVVVGAGARAVADGALDDDGWTGTVLQVDDVDSATEVVREGVRPGDVVLVKASRSVGLDRVATALAGERVP